MGAQSVVGKKRVEAGLRVPGWWWLDDEDESRAAAAAQAIADASDALTIDPSGIGAVEAIGLGDAEYQAAAD